MRNFKKTVFPPKPKRRTVKLVLFHCFHKTNFAPKTVLTWFFGFAQGCGNIALVASSADR